MKKDATADRAHLRKLARADLVAHQLKRLNELLSTVLSSNKFYRRKLSDAAFPVGSMAELAALPTTTKSELIDACEADSTANLTFPLSAYNRVHRTSGTKTRPLLVYDTADDWRWWMDVWQHVLDVAKVTNEDRAFMAFSFGPFVGFWSAYDALIHRGAMVIPSGGLSTSARLDLIDATSPTVVCCTPTYALRMAEVAASAGRNLTKNSVRTLIVAGEPGGSLPAVRMKTEEAWGATVVDHAGATEVGPWGVGNAEGDGLHVIESEFIAEFLPHADKSDIKELVLTSLGRIGWPVIRYRTGDLVKPQVPERGFVNLQGGVVARADEMIVVRGVNVFPSAIEDTLRQFPEIDEFRIVVFKERSMDALRVEVDGHAVQPEKMAAALQRSIGLRVDVVGLADGSLPRFEAKSKRLVDER